MKKHTDYLIFDMKANEVFNINGEEVMVTKNTSLKIKKTTRFMLHNQMMEKENADTPEKLLYWLIQQAYIGPVDERDHWFENAKFQMHKLQQLHWEIAPLLREMEDHLELDNYIKPLELTKKIIAYKIEVENCGPKPHSQCYFSHDIADQIVAGTGKLDGDFEFPCDQCRDWLNKLMGVKNKFVCSNV